MFWYSISQSSQRTVPAFSPSAWGPSWASAGRLARSCSMAETNRKDKSSLTIGTFLKYSAVRRQRQASERCVTAVTLKKRDMTGDNANKQAQNMPSALFAFISLLFEHVCMGNSGKTVNKLSSLPILCRGYMKRKEYAFPCFVRRIVPVIVTFFPASMKEGKPGCFLSRIFCCSKTCCFGLLTEQFLLRFCGPLTYSFAP